MSRKSVACRPEIEDGILGKDVWAYCALTLTCGSDTFSAGNQRKMDGRVSERSHTIEVLAVQFWIRPLDPIACSLQSAGFIARIKRVDIEPALHAALGRQRWDLVLFDAATPELSLESVQQAMKSFRCDAPLLVASDEALADQIQLALCDKRS